MYNELNAKRSGPVDNDDIEVRHSRGIYIYIYIYLFMIYMYIYIYDI